MKKKILCITAFALLLPVLFIEASAVYNPQLSHILATRHYQTICDQYSSISRRGNTDIFDYTFSIDPYHSGYSSYDYVATITISIESADPDSNCQQVCDWAYNAAYDYGQISFDTEYATHIHVYMSIVMDESEYCWCTNDYYWGYDASQGKMCFLNYVYNSVEYE